MSHSNTTFHSCTVIAILAVVAATPPPPVAAVFEQWYSLRVDRFVAAFFVPNHEDVGCFDAWIRRIASHGGHVLGLVGVGGRMRTWPSIHLMVMVDGGWC